MVRIITLILSLALPFAAGALGSFFTAPAIDSWYAELVKPAYNPPGWIFGPVWTALYLLMGIALYRVVSKTNWNNKSVKLFLIHLAVNAFWSVAFFGLQSPGLAFIVILILLALILALIRQFRRLDQVAAWLLVPYLLWVAFATILNFAIWQLN